MAIQFNAASRNHGHTIGCTISDPWTYNRMHHPTRMATNTSTPHAARGAVQGRAIRAIKKAKMMSKPLYEFAGRVVYGGVNDALAVGAIQGVGHIALPAADPDIPE